MGRAHRALALSIAAVAVVAGCGTAAGTGGDPTPSLSYLRDQVFASRCTGPCHSGGENAAGGLDMSQDLHAALISVPATAAVCAGTTMMRVVPDDPEASLLYAKVVDKIEGAAPPCGETMPLGDDVPALSGEESDLIRRWILAGAPDD
jgi:hypothetical protein